MHINKATTKRTQLLTQWRGARSIN